MTTQIPAQPSTSQPDGGPGAPGGTPYPDTDQRKPEPASPGQMTAPPSLTRATATGANTGPGRP